LPKPLRLSAEKALIFRIVHRDNLPWVLRNGLHCRNSGISDPKFTTIGNPDIIDKRDGHSVPRAPGGTLSDYVPFYFTPASPMLLNIITGWRGLRQRDREEIVVLISSLHKLEELQIPYLFTDRHALLAMAEFYSNREDLSVIDWPRLRARDFKYDPEEPDKVDRYQAEALVYRGLPPIGLLGIACYSEQTAKAVAQQAEDAAVGARVVVRSEWFYE
jgi:hypothetical protein